MHLDSFEQPEKQTELLLPQKFRASPVFLHFCHASKHTQIEDQNVLAQELTHAQFKRLSHRSMWPPPCLPRNPPANWLVRERDSALSPEGMQRRLSPLDGREGCSSSFCFHNPPQTVEPRSML